MTYTPVELRHVKIGRRPLGYERSAVEKLLEEVADSFEVAWRERGELGDRVEELEKALAELRRREELLAQALVAAEQAASEVRASAHREAELIVGEAHREGRSIVRGAHAERARLSSDTRRIEALLRAALGMVEDAGREAREAQGDAPAPVPVWPGREDTREFPRPVVPESAEPGELEAQAG